MEGVRLIEEWLIERLGRPMERDGPILIVTTPGSDATDWQRRMAFERGPVIVAVDMAAEEDQAAVAVMQGGKLLVAQTIAKGIMLNQAVRDCIERNTHGEERERALKEWDRQNKPIVIEPVPSIEYHIHRNSPDVSIHLGHYGRNKKSKSKHVRRKERGW